MPDGKGVNAPQSSTSREGMQKTAGRRRGYLPRKSGDSADVASRNAPPQSVVAQNS